MARVREKPLKHLQICTVCGGYMQPMTAFDHAAGGRHWKHETFKRSFGGKEVRRFVCEKCHHVDTFQIDDLGYVGEDD